MQSNSAQASAQVLWRFHWSLGWASKPMAYTCRKPIWIFDFAIFFFFFRGSKNSAFVWTAIFSSPLFFRFCFLCMFTKISFKLSCQLNENIEGERVGAVTSICRDSAGRVVAEIAKPVQASSPLETELLALRLTLVYLEDSANLHGEHDLGMSICTDSLSLVRTVLGPDPSQWELEPVSWRVQGTAGPVHFYCLDPLLT